MIKAARKAAANAELARAFADIFRAPTHEHIATQGRQSGRCGAGCECVEHCGSARARSNACFNHICLRAPAHGHKYEVLIVNDGSTDHTGENVAEFIEGKENCHLLQQENAGLSAARNKVIDYSSGRYLAFIDSDDEICEGFIENLMSAATKNDADIVRGQYFSQRGNYRRLRGIASSFAWGKVYRASLFDKIRFPEGYWFEDMINSFLLTPLSGKTVDLEVPVIIYKNAEGSLSKVQISAVSYKSLEQLYLVMSLIKDYKTLGLTDEAYLHRRIMKECSRLMVRRTEKLDEATRKQVFLACSRIFERLASAFL